MIEENPTVRVSIWYDDGHTYVYTETELEEMCESLFGSGDKEKELFWARHTIVEVPRHVVDTFEAARVALNVATSALNASVVQP